MLNTLSQLPSTASAHSEIRRQSWSLKVQFKLEFFSCAVLVKETGCIKTKNMALRQGCSDLSSQGSVAAANVEDLVGWFGCEVGKNGSGELGDEACGCQ